MTLVKVAQANGDSSQNEAKEKVSEVYMCKNAPDIVSDRKDVCPIDGTEMVQKLKNPVAKLKLNASQIEHLKVETFSAQKMQMTKKTTLKDTRYHASFF